MSLADKLNLSLSLDNDWTDDTGTLGDLGAVGAVFVTNPLKTGTHSASFDGINDTAAQITVPAAITDSLLGAVGIWLYIPSTVASLALLVPFSYGGNDANVFFSLEALSNADSSAFQLDVRIRNGFNNKARTDNSFVTDAWHLFIPGSDGSNYTLYIDNNLEPHTMTVGLDDGKWIGDVSTPSTPSNDQVVLGARRNGGTYQAYYGGQIGQVIMTDAVMTQDDRDSLWNSGNGADYPYPSINGVQSGGSPVPRPTLINQSSPQPLPTQAVGPDDRSA